MRALALALSLLLAASPVLADSEARIGADWVRISATPCKNEEVLKHLKDAGENPLDYRAAAASWQGQDYQACWKPLMQQQMVYVRYTDGDHGLVPFRDLKPVKDI
jgi:hypothetical protein